MNLLAVVTPPYINRSRNAPAITPPPTWQENEQENGQKHHTSNLEHRGRRWRDNRRGRYKTSKQEASCKPRQQLEHKCEPTTAMRDRSSQQETTAKPEVIDDNVHTMQIITEISSGHPTKKVLPIGDKRQNKMHHTSRNDGHNIIEI